MMTGMGRAGLVLVVRVKGAKGNNPKLSFWEAASRGDRLM